LSDGSKQPFLARWPWLTGSMEPMSQGQQNILVAQLTQREIPSLYGLRGVAALVVVVFHYRLNWKLSEFPGHYAVTLFFELSGLLITWLMLKEIDATGKVDLKQFYLRRSLRLFPVFYVVWIICRITGPFAGSWAYLLYLGDYYTALTGRYSALTSAWSLGVEEKFYLIWPQVIVRVGLKSMTRILVAILFLEPLYRYALTLSGHEYYTHFAFETNLDPIVLGCLISIMAKRGWRMPQWMLHPITALATIALGSLCWRSQEAVMVALAILLMYVICKPPLWLNNPVARYLGLISYSWYLCHEYTATVIWPHLLRVHPGSWNQWSATTQIYINLAFGIAAGTLLHYAVEKPFLKLKDRFHPKRIAV
jgi:peptidoglycan/LPS O-acetylase OafA/YrhL